MAETHQRLARSPDVPLLVNEIQYVHSEIRSLFIERSPTCGMLAHGEIAKQYASRYKYRPIVRKTKKRKKKKKKKKKIQR